ncbi:uncharacterized protein ACIGJ3_003302 [Trichechus inunguis]
MVVKLAAPGSARDSLAPATSWGASLSPALGHLRRRRLLSPAEPTTTVGGWERGSQCRGCVEQGDNGDHRRVGNASSTLVMDYTPWKTQPESYEIRKYWSFFTGHQGTDIELQFLTIPCIRSRIRSG